MADVPEIQTERIFREFSIRFGKEILWARPELHSSILAALVNAQEAHSREPNISKAEHLRREFAAEGWLKGGASEPRFSFLRERVAVQILFSDRALLRFLYAFKSDQIDVGVLIVDSKSKLGRVATRLRSGLQRGKPTSFGCAPPSPFPSGSSVFTPFRRDKSR
jgi:hypothetical protein